jgi:hypothetical protein
MSVANHRRETKPSPVQFFPELVGIGADAFAGEAVTAVAIQNDLLTNGFVKQEKTFVLHLGEIHKYDPEMTL